MTSLSSTYFRLKNPAAKAVHIDCQLCEFSRPKLCTFANTACISKHEKRRSLQSSVSRGQYFFDFPNCKSAGHRILGRLVILGRHKRHLRHRGIIRLGPNSHLHFVVIFVLASSNVTHGDVLLQAGAEATTRDLTDVLPFQV